MHLSFIKDRGTSFFHDYTNNSFLMVNVVARAAECQTYLLREVKSIDSAHVCPKGVQTHIQETPVGSSLERIDHSNCLGTR